MTGAAGLGVSRAAWLRYAEQATERWLRRNGPPLPEVARFGQYLRDQRYRVGTHLVSLAADVGVPYEHLALLEQGLLRPSEVPSESWIRLMRTLEGRTPGVPVPEVPVPAAPAPVEPAPPEVARPASPEIARSAPPEPARIEPRVEAPVPQPAPVEPPPLQLDPGISSAGRPVPRDDAIGRARVRVIGVGGGGSNAVARMFRQRVPGVEYVAVNTDVQHLLRIDVPEKLRIGDRITRGLGVGGNPELGREAGEESRDEIYQLLQGCDLVFIAAGMGGGTGTGAAPVVADVARELGALTIAVTTKPFTFEGQRRIRQAEQGIAELESKVDTLIIIPNDRLLRTADQHMTAEEAFRVADEVLRQGVQGIAELITVPGEINLDFADVRTIMTGAGRAWMGIGHRRGEDRATAAAKEALASPLLDVPVEGARRVLLNITGGADVTMREVNEAADYVAGQVDREANIIFGLVTDPRMEDEVRITVIATDLPAAEDQVAIDQGLMAILEESVPPPVPEPPPMAPRKRSWGAIIRSFFGR